MKANAGRFAVTAHQGFWSDDGNFFDSGSSNKWLPELLDQIPPDQEIARVTADGAFDTRKCYDAIAARGAAAIIPPRKKC